MLLIRFREYAHVNIIDYKPFHIIAFLIIFINHLRIELNLNLVL